MHHHASRERSLNLPLGVAHWTVLGLLLGGIGPGIVVLTTGESGLMLGLFVAASELVGVLGGVALGVLDLPGRIARTARGRYQAAAATVAAGLVGLGLGALWGGLAGAAGGLAVATPMIINTPGGFNPGGLLFFASFGAMLGALTAPAGVSLFCGLRALLIYASKPTWPATLVASVATGTVGLTVGSLLLGGLHL
jgi:hypothetical protein